MLHRTRGSPMSTTGSDAFSWFEVPRPFLEPTLRALRLGNTALDALFYDVGRMVTDLFLHGSIFVVDAGRPPRITQFEDVAHFISWVKAHGRTLKTASVTGVGSSALGSAA